MPRPTWDQTWLAVAATVAMRSWCVRRAVGAVVVTRDNRVASVSYNGPPRGQAVGEPCDHWCERAQLGPRSPSYADCGTIHAEANALLRADYTDVAGGTIYVSSAICVNCAKLVANSGLSRAVHVVGEADAHRQPADVEAALRGWGLAVARARDLGGG